MMYWRETSLLAGENVCDYCSVLRPETCLPISVVSFDTTCSTFKKYEVVSDGLTAQEKSSGAFPVR